MLESFWAKKGWEVVHTAGLSGRRAELLPTDDLGMHRAVGSFFRQWPGGIYRHQHMALQLFQGGADVCMATGTASGKSLVFYAAGIQKLAVSPNAKVIAVYPLKALAREQEQRWRQALAAAGIGAAVGRIDGGVPVRERERVLRQSRVVLLTPDVVHAWLLGNLSQPAVRSFLAQLRLVVVDEVHVYSGVFGSNASFLFRRLQHAARVLSGGAALRFIAASATIADPEAHLHKLFARRFAVVGNHDDTSPRHPLEILMVRHPDTQDLNSAVGELLHALVAEKSTRFIAFVDSRRQTERLATIVSRGAVPDEDEGEQDRGALPPQVLPYRSGYEEEDRVAIQERLATGDLRGVISTSALELGLDIQGIDTAVLVGTPRSATSLQQRMGRVGRQGPGRVLILDAGGVADSVVFRDPARLFDRPLSESTLYLENRRIQYIHALCFAASGGEYDMLTGQNGNVVDLATDLEWPEGFLDLCRKERLGEVPPELQSLKTDAGDDSWHTFPLRDVGSQFQVESRGPDLERLGSLSYAQLMREAYPGAVYYYMTRPYRVTRVLTQEKKVVVRRERYYTTDPSAMPPLVSPNLQGEGFQRGYRYDDLSAVECDMFISEAVLGYVERRGSQKERKPYPGDYWIRDRFTRNYTSTGVLLSHPALNQPEVQGEPLSTVILEAFLLIAPFDRAEVAGSFGRHRVARMGFQENDRFIAVFDQTYGSLRLTGRLLEPATLRAALDEARAIAREGRIEGLEPLNQATLAALDQLAAAAVTDPQPFTPPGVEPVSMAENRIQVIMPGSKGWITVDENREFEVEAIFYHPRDGLLYRGRRLDMRPNENLVNSFPVANVQPIPGISVLGEYDLETGELRALGDGG